MSARRRFLARVVMGSAALFSRHAWGAPQPPSRATATQRAALELSLALRIVQTAGAAGLAWPVAMSSRRSVAQLLAAVLGPTTVQDAARLDHGQLQRLLAQRIQQDYQKAALAQHRGWWLAESEAAILELGGRVAERTHAVTDAERA
jgi:hypothetical protein